jgi:hypothetical protein
VTATLEQIHLNPALIDLAISRRERLDIVADDQVQATLLPTEVLSSGDARLMMRERFAARDWETRNR